MADLLSSRDRFHLVKETEVRTDRGKLARVQEFKEGAALLLTLSIEDPNTAIRIEPEPPETKQEE